MEEIIEFPKALYRSGEPADGYEVADDPQQEALLREAGLRSLPEWWAEPEAEPAKPRGRKAAQE
ncbi:MAG TPA: hypothetical protein PKO45_13055 [Rubrivivax sp.]|nr:hypothetical protein [Rubrivivax sp.]